MPDDFPALSLGELDHPLGRMPAGPSQLDRMEAKLDKLLVGADPEVIPAREAMRRLGITSYSTFCRKRKALKIPALGRGRYRSKDITNALAHLALFPDSPR